MNKRKVVLFSLVGVALLGALGLYWFEPSRTTMVVEVVEKNSDGEEHTLTVNNAMGYKDILFTIHVKDPSVWNLVQKDEQYNVTYVSYRFSKKNNLKTIGVFGEEQAD
ncbi:hypothetical protein M1I95_18785 [Rossellomorea marisflavi]|uniref:hypothetical protein n=1 Tax=Rossellomorea marisflavi TaxID=189381 RepID=UPI00279F6DDA|nr:hypothetical protein [Rossellomorea marisflavi]UTE72287.1 hypothetical protein M1I95_18785 [Rossellomorea marisflavi]